MADPDATEIDVSAEYPDSPIRVSGMDHVTVTGSNPEDTIEFYRDLLGMRLVLRQPNLDRPDVTHLFFDTGDGRILTFFVTDDRPSRDAPIETDIDEVHHLAFRIDGERLGTVKEALDDAGKRYSEFDRGAFHSLYTRDNNGLTIELVTDKFRIPDDRRADVLVTAHHERVADGEAYVKDQHMRAALEELDIDIDELDVGDAPAGTGIQE